MIPSCVLKRERKKKEFERERVSFMSKKKLKNSFKKQKKLTQSVCRRAKTLPFSNALLNVFLLSSTPACDHRPSACLPSLIISSPRR